MITRDDIVGLYKTSTTGLPWNVDHVLVLPPTTPDTSTIPQKDYPKTLDFMFTNGAEQSPRMRSYVYPQDNDTIPLQNNFGWTTSDKALGLKIVFKLTDGKPGFTGTIWSDLAATPHGPSQPFVGVTNHPHLNQTNLDAFKALYPDNTEIQAMDLQDLMLHARQQPADGSKATQDPGRAHQKVPRGDATSCTIAIASCLIDTILIFTGTAPLRAAVMTDSALVEVAKIITPEVANLRRVLEKIQIAANAHSRVLAFWDLVRALKTAPMVKKVVGAIMHSLSLRDWIIFGVLVIGTVVALLATGPLAGAAEIAVIAAALATLGSDVDHAVENCSHIPP